MTAPRHIVSSGIAPGSKGELIEWVMFDGGAACREIAPELVERKRAEYARVLARLAETREAPRKRRRTER